MSNHVHALLDFSIQLPKDRNAPFDETKYVQLDTVMKHIKGPSAMRINQMSKWSGAFWQPESYDRYIRNEKHLFQAQEYTYLNPVKAGICKDWRDYPFTYVK
jgi:putative transposase